MTLYIMAVRDAKSELFGRPTVYNTVGAALRQFEDEVNREDRENMLFTHPEDFSFWQLGLYDDVTGGITPETPKMMAQAMEVKKSLPKNISKA